MSTDVYEALRQEIDKMPVGMPKTETGVEIRILEHLFSPVEAQVALHLNILPEPLTQIMKRVRRTGLGFDEEEIQKILDRLVERGSITGDSRGGVKKYSYAQFAIGMFENQVGRMTPEFFADCKEYLEGCFADELFRTSVPQMRAVPVNKKVTHDLHIAHYDDIRAQIQGYPSEPFYVMECICKQGNELVGYSCQTTDLRETCITFPSTASYFKDVGVARPVTKDEVLAILDKAEQEGLVIQPGNAERPGFICCCCGDCCGILTAAKKFPRPAELFKTNYYAEVDPDICNGCGRCIKRCQMDAVALVDRKAAINLDYCIGCGLCVSTCPTEALRLKKKDKQTHPPKKLGQLYSSILREKLGPVRFLKNGLKLGLGKKV